METYHYVTIGLGIVNLFLVAIIYPMRVSIKDVDSDVKLIEKDVKELRTMVQTEYMSKLDFKDHLERIEKSLDEVKAMLILHNKNIG
jgi:hypothetical protein